MHPQHLNRYLCPNAACGKCDANGPAGLTGAGRFKLGNLSTMLATNSGPLLRRTNSQLPTWNRSQKINAWKFATNNNQTKISKVQKQLARPTYVGNHFACSNHGSSNLSQFCNPPLQYQHLTRSCSPENVRSNRKVTENSAAKHIVPHALLQTILT